MSLLNKILTGTLLTSSLIFSGCKKEEATEPQNTLKVECQKIANTYFSWSERLKARDFAGAMSYCVPGSNCEGRTRVHKETWDVDGQSYDDITRISVQLDDEGLVSGDGGALGNTNYYQFIPSAGAVEYHLGFSSSVIRISGKWKIDGINDDHEPNWWGGRPGCEQ
ncbi:MAG: hypothetical protein Q8P79_03160 [Nanoarchaeota archaeon]|nr:hypothetical protein [Nanoarchaeota archaeon]